MFTGYSQDSFYQDMYVPQLISPPYFEDPFPDWLEEKVELPIFDDLPPPPLMNNLDVTSKLSTPLVNSSLGMVTVKSPLPLNNSLDIGLKSCIVNNGVEVVVLKQPQTHPQNLLSVNSIQYQLQPPPSAISLDHQTPVLLQEFDYALNSNTHDTLTPPESPRNEEADLVFTMLQEMQPHELDELVRMRVESLVESPASCVESTRSSLHEESESIYSPSSDSGYSDPEWTATSPDMKTPKKRRVMKPYSRAPPEEKRLRKKEQNKNAATRYRQKKKQEVEEILGEEKQLQQKNEELKSELTELGREIKYLKNLMRDLFKAKGLIK